MKASFIIIALFSIFVFSGCEDDDLCLIGSGTVNTYEIVTTDFERISIYGPINLRYTQGNLTAVTITAEPEMYQHLDHHASRNTLYIGYDENISCFETRHQVWVNVTHPELVAIEADGVNKIVTSTPIEQSSISIDASGHVEVSITGQVDQQILSSSGTLQVKNFGLQTKQTNVDISGSAQLEINCSEILNVDVSGSASIYYQGQPVINRTVDGSLTIEDAN